MRRPSLGQPVEHVFFDHSPVFQFRRTRNLGMAPKSAGIFGRRRVPKISRGLSIFIYCELWAGRGIPVDAPVFPGCRKIHGWRAEQPVHSHSIATWRRKNVAERETPPQGVPYPPPFSGFVAGEISIVKSTLCSGRGWTSREIGVTGSLTPNSDTELLGCLLSWSSQTVTSSQISFIVGR